DDIVIIPAFGTTLELEEKLNKLGIQTEKYDTTCPFVEKVWNRSEQIAKKNYTVIIHGKPKHEETRATFSHAAFNAPAVIVKDIEQARALAKYIIGEKPPSQFYEEFKGQYSNDFSVTNDLQRIGVVNQTTMLASDTQAIADYLKQVMTGKYKLTAATVEERFADTRDTLCYATLENQQAVTGMLQTDADLAIIIGGYNSSNTSHLVELCEEKLPTYFISSEEKIISGNEILHYDFHDKEEILTFDFLPQKTPLKILMTSGASCPDALVEGVINKLTGFYPVRLTSHDLISKFLNGES
ncbi:MAG TPA: 4-hydroxy-3-methylbut-2-enyl diphosphate reductase, partial [Chitinophagaceae bacterium]|nr:4-hydroxy-3-methylbut-2-enyl diphosphate reductase [Chitinophagaceae bacterium]